MQDKKKILGVASDMVFSTLAMAVMHGVIQLFIYPSFARRLGITLYGEAITVMSMVAVVGIGFGIGLNYSRMVMSTKQRDVKGDYNIFLLLSFVLCIPFAVLTEYVYVSEKSVWNTVCIALLMISTVARYYSDVEFKISLNYKHYFVYYVLIAAGYSAGMPVFFLTGNWMVPLMIGETLAVLFTVCLRRLYRRPLLKRSADFKDDFRSYCVLSLSYLADTVIQNADRLLLGLMFSDGAMVSTFYNSALIGKVVALLTVSLNSVLIGYLARFRGRFSRKLFTMVSGALLLVGVAAAFACTLVSNIFIKLMYEPEMYEACKPYFLIANAGQVLYFIASTTLVIVLRFAKEKYQMHVNVLYAVLYLVIVPILTHKFEIWGLAWGILIVNLLKYLIVYVIGMVQFGKQEALSAGDGEELRASNES